MYLRKVEMLFHRLSHLPYALPWVSKGRGWADFQKSVNLTTKGIRINTHCILLWLILSNRLSLLATAKASQLIFWDESIAYLERVNHGCTRVGSSLDIANCRNLISYRSVGCLGWWESKIPNEKHKTLPEGPGRGYRLSLQEEDIHSPS